MMIEIDYCFDVSSTIVFVEIYELEIYLEKSFLSGLVLYVIKSCFL